MVPHVVITWLTTARGGAENSVIELAAHLARLVPHVEVVWWRHGGQAAENPGTAHVHEVTDWQGYQQALARATSLPDDQPVVLISNHRTAAADVLIAPTARVIPVVRHVVSRDQVLRVIDPHTGDLVERTIGDMPWDLLSAVPVWVGISQASAAALREHAPQARFVSAIPNGVTIPVRIPARNRPHTGKLLVAAVARTVPWKRLDVLVRAVADPRLSTSVMLDIFGEPGSHQQELQELVRELSAPVRFMGYSDNLTQRLACYDVLATAALQEGFGRCVIDAAGAAIPSIVPDAGASPELVVDGLTGMVYDPEGFGDLVNTLTDALLCRNELVRMGSAARALAESWYTPGRCAAQYLNLVMGQQPLAAAR
nr:glycosyltransferase family 4 protein [Streptomyces sp. NBC_00886]